MCEYVRLWQAVGWHSLQHISKHEQVFSCTEIFSWILNFINDQRQFYDMYIDFRETLFKEGI